MILKDNLVTVTRKTQEFSKNLLQERTKQGKEQISEKDIQEMEEKTIEYQATLLSKVIEQYVNQKVTEKFNELRTLLVQR